VSDGGSVISADDQYRLEQGLVLSAEHDAEDEATKLVRGKVPLDQWQRGAAQSVRDLYLSLGAFAVGGLSNVTHGDLARIAGNEDAIPSLTFSVGRLFDFAHDVADRAPRANTATVIVDRAGLYDEAGHGIYERARRESHRRAADESGRLQFLFERNVLADSQHCHDGEHTTGCAEATEAGWQPIGSLPLPGARTCGPRCACHLEFSLAGPAEGN
jgi:hypothetical protein